MRAALLHDLRDGGPFFGPHGFATEDLESPHFDPNGYWRGPIWPSASYLIFTGLRDAGETELARKQAERWCAMVARDNIFWENYDPISGEGNNCPALGWTAGVFLRMAVWLGSSSDK